MSKPEFSDEFDFENRILDTSEIPEDNIEGDNPLQKSEESRLTMYFYTALPDSVKQHLRELLQTNSEFL